jgi:4-hydroxybenzoate polyprenyltransferase
LSLVGLLVLLTLNRTAVLLGAASLGLVAAYPFMKRITWWPQAWLGLTFNWGVLVGYAAVAGEAYGALPLYAAGVFWTLGYDTIYAVQDLEDDALAGVKSSARRLGSRAPLGVGVFYLLSAATALAAGLRSGLGPLFLGGWALFALHLAWQARALRIDDPRRALRLFRSNRDAGLILFLVLAAGVWRP